MHEAWTCCGLRDELGTILFGGWCVCTRHASYTVMSGRPPRQHVEVNESDPLRSSSIWSLRIFEGRGMTSTIRRVFVQVLCSDKACSRCSFSISAGSSWLIDLEVKHYRNQSQSLDVSINHVEMGGWYDGIAKRQLLAWSCWGQGRIDFVDFAMLATYDGHKLIFRFMHVHGQLFKDA